MDLDHTEPEICKNTSQIDGAQGEIDHMQVNLSLYGHIGWWDRQHNSKSFHTYVAQICHASSYPQGLVEDDGVQASDDQIKFVQTALLATLLFTLDKLMTKTRNCMYRCFLCSFVSPRSWSQSFLLVRKLRAFFVLLPTPWSLVRTQGGGGRPRKANVRKNCNSLGKFWHYLLTGLLSPIQKQAKFGRNSSSQNSPWWDQRRLRSCSIQSNCVRKTAYTNKRTMK